MSKKILLIISLFICILCLVACSNKTNENNLNTTNNTNTNDTNYTSVNQNGKDEYEVFEPNHYLYSDSLNYVNSLGSTHIYNVSQGTMDLVKDGETSFCIVYPKNASTRIIKAVQLLVQYFEKATGIYINSMSALTLLILKK